jgi:SM-20-related protein
MASGMADAAPPLVLADTELRTLGERGWFVRDGLLGRPASRAVHDAIEALAATGRLRPAGLGRGAGYRVDAAVRGDAIAWIARDDAPAALVPLWDSFQALRDALNRGGYLGLARMEVQVARYPGGGAAYRRHRDAFPTPPGAPPNRRVTAIYYANPAWRPVDGGALRLHGDGTPPVDVAPRLDRLLVFLSERVEHEVLPTRAPRRAVTAWFRARDPWGA